MTVYPSYNEAIENHLVFIGNYRQTNREVKLRADAAVAWMALTAEASVAGSTLIPISGFRTVAYQDSLFKKAVVKHGSEEAAARWVSRPGCSEHHTGLAIDVGEEENPACDVEPPFETTRVFHWLQENARRFGFELSFPRNNSRGVNYEPWHWRFIGTAEAQQIFQS